MSNSVVTSGNGGNVLRIPNGAKYAIPKTEPSTVQNSPILLLTVQYPPQNGLPKPSKSSEQNTDVTFNNQAYVQRIETVPYSLVNVAEPIVKNVEYDNSNVQIFTSKQVSSFSPVLVVRNDSVQEQNSTVVQKATFSQDVLPNNILFTPVPKSVVCTVMAIDGKGRVSKVKKESSEIDEEAVCEPEIISDNNQQVLEDFSSGEDDSVHIISDKPVTCRAVASLPVKFLYFGTVGKDTAKTTTPTGVFARVEIPRKAHFGPMEGVLISKFVAVGHHLELTVEKYCDLQRLDVSDENSANWMKYVRPAKTVREQNLSLQQIGNHLYFNALRNILPHEELKVWYSPAYAKARNLPLLNSKTYQQTEENITGLHMPGREEFPMSGSIEESNDENISNLCEQEDECYTEIDGSERKWKCTHCRKVFRSATFFNLHVLSHAADNLETNDICDNASLAVSLEESDSVTLKKYKKPTLECHKCSKSFNTNSALACHLKCHEDVKTFDCPICQQIFCKVLDLKKHIHTHSVGGVFYCPHCTKKFNEYPHVRNHIRRFHSVKNFTCEKCGKLFPTLDKLRIHMLSHSDYREFACATCGKQFKRKDKLTFHIKKVHLNPRVRPTTDGDKASPSKKTASTTDYSDYIYKCHICEVGFKRRGMLVNHLAKRHPGVTPESVPELNLPILRASRDYYCQYCGKTYKSSSKRKAHILKNHPGEKLPLNDRQLASMKDRSKEENYSQTVGSVTTNPQPCNWCHKQYASKAKLLQHQREKHLHELPKALQQPKKPTANKLDEDSDTVRDEMDRVIGNDIFLPEALDISEYELSVGDSKFFPDGAEVIIDAQTLRRAIKEDALSVDCSPESLSELSQMLEARPDGYFKVYQGQSGITLAHPVEVWDPLTLCLSPPADTGHMLSST